MNETLIPNIDLDLSSASARPPLLPKQTLKCRVGESGATKTKDGKDRMVISLVLEEPGKDQHGNPVAVGFRVIHGFMLQESGGWTKERAAQELLRSKMAVEGIDEATAKSTPTNTKNWVGRYVMATFDIAKDGENQNIRLEACKG